MLLVFTGCFAWFFLALTFPETLGRTPLGEDPPANALVRGVKAVSLLARRMIMSELDGISSLKNAELTSAAPVASPVEDSSHSAMTLSRRVLSER